MEVHGSGPVNVLRTFNVIHVNQSQGDNNKQDGPRQVIEPLTREEIGDRSAAEVIEDIRTKRAMMAQGKVPAGNQNIQGHQQQLVSPAGQTDRPVNASKPKRMKRIIRIKRNAQGVELSREEEMVPMPDDDMPVQSSMLVPDNAKQQAAYEHLHCKYFVHHMCPI